MLLRQILILIGLFLIWNLSIDAQTNSNGEEVDSNFYIYVAMGQSNMAGRGKVDGKYSRMKHRRVFMLDKDQKWVKAMHPVHFDKPQIAGVGPALSFGIEMAKAHKGKKIGLVPCAVGGTSIQHWKPGAYDERTDTHGDFYQILTYIFLSNLFYLFFLDIIFYPKIFCKFGNVTV